MNSRLETLVEERPFDLECDGFTSRATMAIGPTLALAGKLVRSGGRAFLWKGSSHESERLQAEKQWTQDWDFESASPLPSGQTSICIFIRK